MACSHPLPRCAFPGTGPRTVVLDLLPALPPAFSSQPSGQRAHSRVPGNTCFPGPIALPPPVVPDQPVGPQNYHELPVCGFDWWWTLLAGFRPPLCPITGDRTPWCARSITPDPIPHAWRVPPPPPRTVPSLTFPHTFHPSIRYSPGRDNLLDSYPTTDRTPDALPSSTGSAGRQHACNPTPVPPPTIPQFRTLRLTIVYR